MKKKDGSGTSKKYSTGFSGLLDSKNLGFAWCALQCYLCLQCHKAEVRFPNVKKGIIKAPVFRLSKELLLAFQILSLYLSITFPWVIGRECIHSWGDYSDIYPQGFDLLLWYERKNFSEDSVVIPMKKYIYTIVRIAFFIRDQQYDSNS